MGKEWDAPWKYVIAGHGFTDGGERLPAPSFTSNRNPTCQACGHRQRTWEGGPEKCECEEPEFDSVQDVLSDRQKFQAWCVLWLTECHRVLRPGGVIKVFGATRMMHRMAAAMEDAGFVLDPENSLEGWAYGCLTEDTEILTFGGWEPYHRAKVGTLVLGFDLGTGQFDWQPVEETFEYPYDRDAFRLVGDGTDHIVSVEHRCVVQRGGQWVKVLAGGLEATEVVPCVSWSVPAQDPQAEDMRAVLCQQGAGAFLEATRGEERAVPQLHGLRDAQVVSRGVDQEGHLPANVLQEVQRGASGPGLGETGPQGGGSGDACGTGIGHPEDDRASQPRVEGRGDVLQEARELRPARPDQVRSVSPRVSTDGPQGRVHHGASADRSSGAGSMPTPNGDGASPEPQPDGQSPGEPGTVRLEPGPQVVRGSRLTSPDLAGVTASIERVHYTGIVWCVKVPSGAFVARRNGMAFVTGNSGFPKSLNLGKVLDKMAGAEREVVGTKAGLPGWREGESAPNEVYGKGISNGSAGCEITAPATAEAKQFAEYGTALKPGWEPFVVGTKQSCGVAA